MMPKAPGFISVLAFLLLVNGCSALVQPDREYANNQGVIEYTARAAAYSVDGDAYLLQRIEIEWDTATFYYAGVSDPREDVWVLRFSPKSSEQDPVALEDVYSHLTLIEGLRDDFKVGADEEDLVGESSLRHVSYSYQSKSRDSEGKAVRGHGIIAVYSTRRDDLPVVYAMKIEAVGRKVHYTRKALAPFLRPIPRP